MKIKESFKGWFGSKQFKLGGYSAAAGILAVMIAVVAVMIAEGLPSAYTQLDISGKNLYSISNETKNIVKNIESDVEIYLLAQESEKDSIIDKMLQRYEGLSGKIKYSVKDPVKNPSFAKKYTSSEISQNSIIVVCGEKSKYIDYYDIYKTDFDYETYTKTSEFDGENCVTSAISYVVSTETPQIYTLSGHGERQLDDSFEEMIHSRNIDVSELSLISEEEIPRDAECVIINEPQSDITENEAALLKAYADKGGDLIVISGYTGEDKTNLNELMAYYGCELETDMIIEADSSKYIQGFNYYLLPSIKSHKITDPLRDEGYYVLTPMAVNIANSDNGRGNVNELLITSSRAYAKYDTANMDTLEKTDKDIEGIYTVGVVSTIGEGNSESKLLLVSATGFLTSKISQAVAGGNADLFINAVNWMTGKESGIAIHAKPLKNDVITVSDKAAGILSFVLIFLIPMAVVAVGIYVLRKRKKR